MTRSPALSLLFTVLLNTTPSLAYEYPLSTSAIRDAYFLGTGSKGTDESFYEHYARTIPNPGKEPPVSTITIDTPYMQFAEHARQNPNQHVQDAVEEYFGKSAKFLVFADVYFKPLSGKPNSGDSQKSREGDSRPEGLEIRLRQNKKVIPVKVVDESPLYPFRNAQTSAKQIGEHVELECDPASIDASILTISIRTPDGQNHEVTFDLAHVN